MLIWAAECYGWPWEAGTGLYDLFLSLAVFSKAGRRVQKDAGLDLDLLVAASDLHVSRVIWRTVVTS